MIGLGRLRQWLRARARRAQLERDMDDEMRMHLEMEAEDLVRTRRLSPAEARRQARLGFGGVDRFKEEGRDVRRSRILEDVLADVRYALRALGRSPAFTAAAVLTLALGIGANTAIFSVVDALFLRHPAGVREGADVLRLYMVRDEGMIQSGPRSGRGSYIDYRTIRAGVPLFSDVAAFLDDGEIDLGRGEEAQRIRGRVVTQSFFPLLGVGMAEGRGFTAEEDSIIGAHPVAVISHSFWQRQFGGDPAVVGSTVFLNGQVLAVIGVAEAGFVGIEADPIDVWVPAAMASPLGLMTLEEDWRGWPFMVRVNVMGRVRPGVPAEAAVAQSTAALRHAAEATPELDPTPDVVAGTLVPAGGPHRPQSASLALWLLLVTGIVLVVACANVANLLLSRATTRRRETAVRLSLGAGGGRLVRQHLTESLVLAMLGGAAGVVVALLGSRIAQQFPVPPAAGALDVRLLLFALGFALATGVVFGLAPALRAGRVDATDGLKDGRASGPPGRGRLRRTLVALQVSLSVLLLVGAGLFVRSLRAVSAVDPGLDVDGLLVVSVDLNKAGYPLAEREAFYRDARERVLRLPGVRGAALAQFEPFPSGWHGEGFRVPGRDSLRIENGPWTNWVGADYFRTVGTAVLRGRGISDRDVSGGEPAAVINEALARALASVGDPLGLCVAIGDQVMDGGCTRIIGIAEDQRLSYLNADTEPMIYLPRDPTDPPWAHVPHLLVRTRGEAAAVTAEVRAALQSLRPNLPYVSVEPLTARIRPQLRRYELGATLFTLFGVLALSLAAIGLAGVLGYFVAERTPELGIRRALGARDTDVIRLVIRQAMPPVAAGLALGLAAAFAGATLLEALLYGVSGRDAISFILAAGFLAVVALVASYIPARRATGVGPMTALRAE